LLQPQDINAWVWVEREIAPQPQNRAIYDAMYAEYLRLYLGSKDVVHRLKAITAGHF
jgi:sugar (pentulose or hexulose) kinase